MLFVGWRAPRLKFTNNNVKCWEWHGFPVNGCREERGFDPEHLNPAGAASPVFAGAPAQAAPFRRMLVTGGGEHGAFRQAEGFQELEGGGHGVTEGGTAGGQHRDPPGKSPRAGEASPPQEDKTPKRRGVTTQQGIKTPTWAADLRRTGGKPLSSESNPRRKASNLRSREGLPGSAESKPRSADE
jgi:hypothetical protein